jgi:hypothetical protein
MRRFLHLYILFFFLILSSQAEGVFVQGATEEVNGLVLKGNKVLTFSLKTVEGSKEGVATGTTSSRDESLRLNISGRAAGTDVDATIISTSTTGTDVGSQNEDKVSISLKRASTEVYWGDFTANFEDVEFARLDKVLSGLRITGDYDKWGFKAIASTPRGDSKTVRMYGDGTQGPYLLGYSPVVIDSERVWLNGVEQRRGDDYDIDYEGGTITFRKSAIIATSIIKVDFDYRRTPYQHSTYGLRFKGDVLPDLRLGATYISDSDSLYGARETRDTMTSNPIDPISHNLIGLDGSYGFGQELKIDSEFAYSEKNPNIIALSTQEVVYRDTAFKLSTSSDIGPATFSTRFKRIGPDFQSIADADPKQDLRLAGGDVSFKPNEVFYAEGNYDNESYLQSGVRYSNTGLGTKMKVTPSDASSFSYFFDELEESNDPVSGDSIDRMTVRNAAEAMYQHEFLKHILSGSHERRVSRTPSEEVTVYRILGYGASTVGFDKFSISGNLELKETEEPSGDMPITKTYILNLSATPVREFFASASFHQIDDSQEGITTVTDLGYRAEPMREVRTEGKYNITSIKEDFGATPEAVSKQSGSFRVDLRPLREIRLRHTYKPSFTMVRDRGILSYNDNSNQSEITWSPLRQLSTGIIYRDDEMYSLDKEAISLERLDERESVKSTTLTLKAAPIRIMSIEFNYTIEDLFNTQIISREPVAYDDTTGRGKNFEASIKTSLSEWFSLDSRYTNEKIDQISTDSSNDIDTLSQSGSVKGTWNLDESWSFYLSGAYTETIDNLAATDPLTYTVSPGLGFIYRITNVLRVEGSYTYSKSYLGADTEKGLYSLSSKYDVNEYVHLTFNFDQETSVSPDYRVTDILGSIEIDL